jgi:hypothetical protein
MLAAHGKFHATGGLIPSRFRPSNPDYLQSLACALGFGVTLVKYALGFGVSLRRTIEHHNHVLALLGAN